MSKLVHRKANIDDLDAIIELQKNHGDNIILFRSVEQIIDKVGLPCFIKPNHAGSSYSYIKKFSHCLLETLQKEES